jgi:F0F1-type ATP synthase alpha subunit
VGGHAQIKAMKKVAGSLRLDMAQYRELSSFAQFASDLDEASKRQLSRGERLTEVLKQDQFIPLSVEKQVVMIYLAINGLLDKIPVNNVAKFEETFIPYLNDNYPELLLGIAQTGQLNEDAQYGVKTAVESFIAAETEITKSA